MVTTPTEALAPFLRGEEVVENMIVAPGREDPAVTAPDVDAWYLREH